LYSIVFPFFLSGFARNRKSPRFAIFPGSGSSRLVFQSKVKKIATLSLIFRCYHTKKYLYGIDLDGLAFFSYHTEMKTYDSSQPNLFPLHIRTAYVDLLARLQDLQAGHAIASLSSCSLIVKRVRAKEYLYAQGRVADGTARQVYIAPYDDAGKALMQRFREEKAGVANEKSAIEMTAKALHATGMLRLDTVEWRVVNALAEDGIFRVGGVLVGTIAYRCIVNFLGVKLLSASALTEDVDIAGKTVPVAIIPEVVCPQTALERLEMGFSPMMEADPALYGSRSKAREGEFKVEFLTPLVGRSPAAGKRSEIRQLGVPAIPLRFLDYLIEQPLPAVALGRRPVLVRVPQPARYAVHKLIVAQERDKRFALKAQKDLEQSFDLQNILKKMEPEGLDEAFHEARRKGPGWRKRVDAGQEAMQRLFG
jgi:hypothetical protein